MTTLFDNPDGTNPQAVVPPQTTDYTALLGLIQNEEGKPKYASVEKAFEALAHSQAYIERSKIDGAARDAELAELRAKLAEKDSIKDTLERLSRDAATKLEQPPGNVGLNEESVEGLIKSYLEKQNTADRAAANKREYVEAMKAKFGDKAAEVTANKAAELGLSNDAFADLVLQSPKAALAYFSVAPSKGTSATTTSQVSSLSAPAHEELKRPEKSLLAGAKNGDLVEFMRKVKEDTYRKFNVEI